MKSLLISKVFICRNLIYIREIKKNCRKHVYADIKMQKTGKLRGEICELFKLMTFEK